MVLALALAGLLGLAPQQSGMSPPEIDFQALGEAFVAERCNPGASAACTLEETLSRGYAHLDVGPFALEFPKSLLCDKDALPELRGIVNALATATLEWVRWQGAGDALAPELEAFWPKWTAKWKALKPADVEHASSRDVLDLEATAPEERALVEGLHKLCHATDRLALVVPDDRQVRLILAPTRLEFMQWNGYGGLLDESLRPVNWRPDASQWAQFWIGWDLVLALEYAPWGGYDPTFKASQPMEKIGKGLMFQHVVQQGTLALLRSCRPTVPESRTDSAFAMLLTIRACGEVNTVEGAGGVSSSGATTAPYERFVPGGNPAGGTLPGRSAAGLDGIVENRWRKGHGTDGFAAPLKIGQAEGAKAVKGEDGCDPLATFVLKKEDGTGKHLVHAPFFGPHANEQPYPPADYLVDYAEFFRAYKTGFFAWLAQQGSDPKAEGGAAGRWTALVRGLATLDETKTFDALAEEVYGLPLSGKDGSTDSLEWRFLKSLPKAK